MSDCSTEAFKPKKAQLKPCPFCGSEDIDFHFIARKSCGVMVKCKKCGSSSGIVWMTKANGYHDGAEQKAAQLWNQRYAEDDMK